MIPIASLSAGLNAAVPIASVVTLGWLNQKVGFGAGAHIHPSAKLFVADGLGDTGANSLRAALESPDPLYIIPRISNASQTGAIYAARNFEVKPHKVIDGRTANLTLYRYGLNIERVSNVIVYNIAIRDGIDPELDAIQMIRAEDIWIHHCSLSRFGDGLIDNTISSLSEPLGYDGYPKSTVSWCRFGYHNKTAIVGNDAYTGSNEYRIRATWHHNFFDETTQRHPRVSQAYVHAYNNVVKFQDTGMACHDAGFLLAEYNWFEGMSAGNPVVHDRLVFPEGTVAEGNVSLRANVFEGCPVGEEYNAAVVDEAPYAYVSENATPDMRSAVINGSGRQNIPYV